jgi:hypothetical protein
MHASDMCGGHPPCRYAVGVGGCLLADAEALLRQHGNACLLQHIMWER